MFHVYHDDPQLTYIYIYIYVSLLENRYNYTFQHISIGQNQQQLSCKTLIYIK